MKDTPVRGQTSNIGFVLIPDASSSTLSGLTGLTNASGGLGIAVRRELSSAMTAYSGGNIGTISTLGTWANPGSGKVNFKEVDSTNAPGLYELHFEDAIFNTGDASRKLIGFVKVTGGVGTPFEVPLLALNFQSASVTTTYQIKKNTALTAFMFVMTDSTTDQPASGLTVTGTVSLDGGAFASLTNSASEIGSTGVYKINLAAGDVNGNTVMLKFAATGANTTLS